MTRRPPKPKRVLARPGWQRFLRASVLGVLILAAGYVTLPWWLPPVLVRTWIARDLAGQLGVAVTIDRASISWGDGITLEGLHIASPPGYGDEPMVAVDRIQAEFAPLRYVLARRIQWMDIDRPKVLAAFDEQWQSNLAVLDRLSSPVTVERVIIEQAAGILALPRADRRVHLDIGHMQFEAGRLQSLGQITVAAVLRQHTEAAPIHLHVESGRLADPVASRLELQFHDVDLMELPLEALLPPGVKHLAGLCAGSLELQVNRRGQVDQFRLDVVVRDLVAEPVDRTPLPPVPLAELHLDAAYDPLLGSGQLTVRSLEINVPDALNLQAKASLFTNALAGDWEAVASLEAEGSIWPLSLATMLGYRPADNETILDGPARFSMAATRDGQTVDMHLALNATDGVLRRGQRTLKPARRPLSLNFAGRVDERTWHATVDRGDMVLAGNTFTVEHADIDNLHQRFGRDAGPAGLAGLLRNVAGLACSGRWRISDLAAIADILPSLAPALTDVTLDGEVAGAWALRRQDGPHLELLVDVPGRTHLTVGERFRKPHQQALSLQLTAALSPDGQDLKDLQMDLTTGAGRIRLDDVAVATDDGRTVGTGRLEATNIQEFGRCFPAMEGIGRIAGRLRGEVNATIQDDQADVVTTFRNLDLTWTEPQATKPTTTIAGALSVSGHLRRRTDTWLVQLDASATGLEARHEGWRTFYKPAGVPLDIHVDSAQVSRTNVVIDRLHARLAESTVTAQGIALADGDLERGRVRATLVLPTILARHDPDLAALMQNWQVAGEVHIDASVSTKDEALHAALGVHATDVTFQSPTGLVKPTDEPLELSATIHDPGPDEPMAIEIRQGRLGPIAFAGHVDLTFQPFASRGRLTCETQDIESLGRLLADATVRPIGGTVRAELAWQATPGEWTANATWNAEKLQVAHRGHGMEFGGEGSASLTCWPEQQRLRFDALSLTGLRFELGRTRGWLVADLTGPTIPLQGPETIDRGAPTPQPPLALAGDIHLIAETVDAIQLAEWFSEAPTTTQPPMTMPGDDPFNFPARDLTDAEQADLIAQAGRVISNARPALQDCDVSVKAKIGRLRSYDALVAQAFDLVEMQATATIRHGQIDLEYGGGLNSGTLVRTYSVNLNEEAPFVHHVSDIQNARADRNIQAMLAYRFPGNMVEGYFSHSEDVQIPLVNVIANAMDPFFALRPVGTGTTIAIDGITQGQSAPKFIARIFPGLKTTRYRYQHMTAFEEYAEDGSAASDIIFNGPKYDTYMDGRVGADYIGDYEIGVILVNTPQTPEWNHRYRQGRIPILKFEGRIKHGRLDNVKVAYPWPTETLYVVFLKNNYFYRMWVESQHPELATPDEATPEAP